jgi:hypothetical protein
VGEELEKPPIWRVALGFLLAPLIAALAFSLFEDHSLNVVVPAAMYGGYPAAIVLGIPAYVLLHGTMQPRFWVLMIVGGVIAVLPWMALALTNTEGSSQVGNCQSTIDGRMTWCGFLGNLWLWGYIFCFGALGGLAFWGCVAFGLKPKAPSDVAA